MPYALFYSLFPEIAKRETRTITVFDGSTVDLPPGEYAFTEMFCDEPHCDCRRVFFYVLSNGGRRSEAVIAYGWESREFYVQWAHEDDPNLIDNLMGPVLNIGSPQSALAPVLLDFVENVLLQDTAYIDRVKRHYRMFRDRIDGKDRRDRPGALKLTRRKT